MSKIPITVISAKSKYEAKEQALQAFISQNKPLFEEFERLLVDRNEACIAFKAKVEANHAKLGGSYGPYKIQKGKRTFNSDKFMQMMGDDGELYVKDPAIDPKAFDAGVKSGAIPDEVVQAVTSSGNPVIKGPKPIAVYQ